MVLQISGRNNRISSTPRPEAAAATPSRLSPAPSQTRDTAPPATPTSPPAPAHAPPSPVRGRLLPQIVTCDPTPPQSAEPLRRKLSARGAPNGTPRRRFVQPHTPKIDRELGIGGRDVNGVDLDVYDGGVTGGSSTRHVFRTGLDTPSQLSACEGDAKGADGNPVGGAAVSTPERRRAEDRVPAEALGGDASFLNEELSQLSSFWGRTPSPREGAPAAADSSSRMSASFTNGWTQPTLGASVGAFVSHPPGSTDQDGARMESASMRRGHAELTAEALVSGRLELEVLAAAQPDAEAACGHIRHTPPAAPAAASPPLSADGPSSLTKRMTWLTSSDAQTRLASGPRSMGALDGVLRGATCRDARTRVNAQSPVPQVASSAATCEAADTAAPSLPAAPMMAGPRSDSTPRKGMAWRQHAA